ncbi:WD40-repeat-containing domain protein [Gilbertella persicaria]|uniref:WD40-repeat-containing domain protein n=1 Tax=Gilbertella persicaria TaxID=101096 RepID=UPI00221FEFD9|nr:WD40-repeat-containing domain protein [Gilbertella persicaria]KAI8059385.1 WD40-repeat-containing domain protein [Gilbertella persicaria]
MDRRKEELEKKRQKLAELRRAREERRALLESQSTQSSSTTSSTTGRDRKAIDDLVALVLGERPSTPSAATTTAGSDRGSDAGSEFSNSRPTSANFGYSSPGTPMSQSDARLSMLSTTSQPAQTTPHYVAELTEAQTFVADIPPLEQVVYSKEIQTTDGSLEAPEISEEEIRKQITEEFELREKQKIAQLEEEIRKAEQEKQEEIRGKQKVLKKKIELTEEEAKTIQKSQEFAEFVDISTKLVERALNEKYDFMKDYTLGIDVENDENSGKHVKFVCKFWDEKWCKNRSVTDVNWSLKYPELVVSSYNKNPLAPNEPDGVALVWNEHLLDRPEFVFHSQSDVLSVMFSKFHPNYIIGGTYSGQIVLWDTRAKSLPVLKTPLSAGGHTHPVYSIEMVGTQNAHNLISASTDGFICSWQLDMLAQPQDYLELLHPAHNKTDEVSVTCMGFPDNETTAFWAGTEEGNIYQANRYDRAGSKAGINQYDTYRGHHGMVTGLNFHPLHGPVDFSDLYLTSSVDWTVKLWRAKSISKTSTQPSSITPLYSFEHADDYVYDVKWSPTHPALFGTVDGTGQFDLWNLNADTEEPFVSTQVGSGKALNKIAWDKEGKKTAIGSSDGHVYVYDIGEMAIPKPEDWSLLQKNISEMISNQENPPAK